jgi:hypothetical protein
MAAIIFSATGNMSEVEFDATLSVVEFDATLAETHQTSVDVTKHPVERGVSITDHVRPNEDRVMLECIVTNTPINDMAASHFLGALGRIQVAAPLRMQPAPLTLAGVKVAGELRAVGMSKQLRTAQIKGPNLPRVPQLRGGVNSGYRDHPVQAIPGAFKKDVPFARTGTALQSLTPTDRVKAVYELLYSLVRSGVEVQLVTDLREYPSMVIKSLSAPKTAMDAIIFSMELEEIRFASTKLTEVKALRVEEKRAQAVQEVGPVAPYPMSLEEEAHRESVVDQTVDWSVESVVN